jgi:hypothetical protein
VPGGLPGLPQRRDHHGEVVRQVVGTTVPIPIRRERLDELAENHQHCRSVHAAIDRDRARLHCLVNYRGDLDRSIKRVLALHNATRARDLRSLPTCVPDHEAPHRGVQALIGGNWLAARTGPPLERLLIIQKLTYGKLKANTCSIAVLQWEAKDTSHPVSRILVWASWDLPTIWVRLAKEARCVRAPLQLSRRPAQG